MIDQQKDYFIAVGLRSRRNPPKNWLDFVSSLEDVDVINATEFRAKIKATPLAVQQIRHRFKDALMVEEILERKSL